MQKGIERVLDGARKDTRAYHLGKLMRQTKPDDVAVKGRRPSGPG
jgi:hypothetical protein